MKLTLALLLITATALAAEPWKLQPLQYNDPELTVDLGVGLWAWPLAVRPSSSRQATLSRNCTTTSWAYVSYRTPTIAGDSLILRTEKHLYRIKNAE